MGNIYMRLLILCTILFQGIESLSDNRTTDSLDLLVRKKRIIDSTPGSKRRPRFQDVPYIVNVLGNGHHICAGSILSARVILTAANCVEIIIRYTVVAGTVLTNGTGSGTIHLVNGILRHPSYISQSFANNIALLSLLEPILLGPGLNQPIQIYQLHNGQLPSNTLVTTSGWGLALESCGGMILPDELRSIRLPTISLEECRNYQQHAQGIAALALNQFICTHHIEKKCSAGDDGNPLVFEGHLVGVLAWYGIDGPSIFLNVALPAFRNWTITHMNRIPPVPLVPMEPLHLPREPNRRQLQCSKVHPCHD